MNDKDAIIAGLKAALDKALVENLRLRKQVASSQQAGR